MNDDAPTVQSRVDRLFLDPAAAAPLRAEGFAAGIGDAQAEQPFSPFDRDDIVEAQQLADAFGAVAAASAGEAAGHAVMDAVERELGRRRTALVQHAFKIFASRTPAVAVRVPTFREIATRRAAASAERGFAAGAEAPGEPTPEPEMDYFRHDIDLSDHHDHWHVIYPGGFDGVTRRSTASCSSTCTSRCWALRHRPPRARPGAGETVRRDVRRLCERAGPRDAGPVLGEPGVHRPALQPAPGRLRRRAGLGRQRAAARAEGGLRPGGARARYARAEELGADIEGITEGPGDPPPATCTTRATCCSATPTRPPRAPRR